MNEDQAHGMIEELRRIADALEEQNEETKEFHKRQERALLLNSLVLGADPDIDDAGLQLWKELNAAQVKDTLAKRMEQMKKADSKEQDKMIQ